jgi:hypothetical protein
MTSTTRPRARRKPALRTLDAAQLQAVSGGMIIYGSTSIIFWHPASDDPSLGGPDTTR